MGFLCDVNPRNNTKIILYQTDTSWFVEYTKSTKEYHLRNSANLSCILCIKDVEILSKEGGATVY